MRDSNEGNLIGLLALAIPLDETPEAPPPPDTLTPLTYDVFENSWPDVQIEYDRFEVK